MPFDYQFFFSYRRSDSVDKYLERLFEDLDDMVRLKAGLAKRQKDVAAGAQPVRCGFIDWRDIELGEDWDEAIAGALRQAKVLVTLCSPGYFKSDYCGREVALFQQLFGPRAHVKPVVWVNFRIEEAPAPFCQRQLYMGQPDALQNTKGMLYLLKQAQMYGTEYNDAVDTLADIIVSADERDPLLPAGAPLPRLADTLSWPPPGGGRAAGEACGPRHVRFVYVAADPQRFGAARDRSAYVEAGSGDWRPFWPECPTRIAPFAQNVVSADSLGFSSQEMAFGPDLVADIEDAFKRREIVVLIVDGWSLQWDRQYKRVLQELDQHLDYHWCVLVPSNANDRDSAARHAEIEAALNSTFDRHINLAPNPLFYRADIASPDDLRRALVEVVTRLKDEITKRASIDRPVPAGPASVPTMAGPGKQG